MVDIDEARQLALSVGWLATRPRDFADGCLKRMVLQQYNTGDYLLHVDDEPGLILLIVSGAVLVTLRHPVLDPYLGHLRIRGDWLGEMAALHGGTRRTGLEAATSLVTLCLTFSSAREMMTSRPEVAQHFTTLLAWNYEIALRSGVDFTLADPLQRICARLLTLGGFGRNWPENAGPIFLPITKEQLASMAAVSRNSVRVLKILEERGICYSQYGGITIHDAVALRLTLQSALHHKSG